VPIPSLTNDGLLPEGIHDCSMADLRIVFGSFSLSDRRPNLFRKLEEFANAVRSTSLKAFLIVDGSFATRAPEPNDVDVVLVLPGEWQWPADLRPDEYNVLSSKRAKRLWGIDLLIARNGRKEYAEYIGLFQRVRYRRDIRKGVLRIEL